jgi:hypothetical protein
LIQNGFHEVVIFAQTATVEQPEQQSTLRAATVLQNKKKYESQIVTASTDELKSRIAKYHSSIEDPTKTIRQLS